jgi:hypothetical protein
MGNEQSSPRRDKCSSCGKCHLQYDLDRYDCCKCDRFFCEACYQGSGGVCKGCSEAEAHQQQVVTRSTGTGTVVTNATSFADVLAATVRNGAISKIEMERVTREDRVVWEKATIFFRDGGNGCQAHDVKFSESQNLGHAKGYRHSRCFVRGCVSKYALEGGWSDSTIEEHVRRNHDD